MRNRRHARFQTSSHGFTLVELLVVLSIMVFTAGLWVLGIVTCALHYGPRT